MGRTRKRRRGGKDRKGGAAKVAKAIQPLYNVPPYDLVDEEKVAMIHDKSMQILEEGGIGFFYEPAVDLLRKHGVRVDDDQIAYFDREMVMEYLAKAPGEFTWAGRNPERNVKVGGKNVIFAPVVGPPFVHDRERGRRPGTLEDLNNFIKLAQKSDYLHSSGAEIVVPDDVPIDERHLDNMYSLFKYSDKPAMGLYGTGQIARDSIEIAKLVFGEEELKTTHALHGVVNVSSPRRLDDRMLSLMFEFGNHNQIIDVTPFILSGAMGPVSILGTVAQLNAEALAGIVFMQMINPGNPCVYGSFQAIIDLQSGSPVFGAPESQLALYLSGQMARHYKIPFRAAGAYSSSKVSDAQSAYESVMAMMPSMMVQPNFVLHAAGWLENGLTAGYEKFVLDNELLGMYSTYLKGINWDDGEWAMDEIINQIKPGGHHLGTQHTMDRMRTAFYRAELFDYDASETWMANGGLDSAERATIKWKADLDAYEQPDLDPAIDEAMLDWIARRRPEVGSSFLAE